MSQRRDARSPLPTIALVAAFVLLLGAVYWFVIRDDSDKKDAESKAPGKVAAKTFTAPGNSFSFKYPGNFVETSGPRGYVWIAGVGTYDILSVKRIDNKPTAPARLLKTVPRTLKADPFTKIQGQGTEQHAGLDMVNFKIETTIEEKPTAVDLYFFSANGVTWQLACESQTQAALISSACDAALQSFKVLS